MAAASPYITETTVETFEADVVQKSMECLVLVDFWAPWCEPCRMLTPLLEKVVAEYAGKIQLVKINIDDQQQLAQAFGVQSIPLVVALREGQPLDQFAGVLDEEQLRQWVSQMLPSRTEELFQKGMELEESDDPAAAEACYREAAELSPEEDAVKVALARVTLAQDRDEEAARIIAELEQRGYLEPDAERVKSQLELRAAADEAGDVSEARAAAEASPDDLSLQLKLAEALSGSRKHEEALQICLTIIDGDKAGVGADAKETMVRIFDTLGPSSELTSEYRRKLATAWY